MEHLANLLVSIIELAEAELESLKRGVLRLGLSVVFLIVAGLAGVMGLVLVLAAVFMLLQTLLNTTAALAISGAVFLGVAAVLGFLAMHRPSKPKVAAVAADDGSVPTGNSHEQIPPIRIAS